MAFSVTAIQATAGTAVTSITFRANSLHDPEYTSGGTQPYQYDQLVPFYGGYIVYGVKVHLEFYNPLYDGIIVGCRIRLASATATQDLPLSTLIQYPRVIAEPLMNTGSQKWSTSFYVAVNDIYGITKTQYQDPTYASSTSTNPSSIAPLIEPFVVNTVAGEANTVRCRAQLIYYCRLYDPVVVAVS